MSSNAQVRRRAVQAARGESPFDLLLIDAQIRRYGHGRNSRR